MRKLLTAPCCESVKRQDNLVIVAEHLDICHIVKQNAGDLSGPQLRG